MIKVEETEKNYVLNLTAENESDRREIGKIFREGPLGLKTNAIVVITREHDRIYIALEK